ncbi:hypothetical protein HPP92_020139 [Vanilla planifolia]|uniref:Uncharacterized protein n=1 Tax=Vanilla planifolia TaxID=51239 RepID=A0A835Q4I2_VANPL|nr:hypothetical protein HPP92_020139 [Vanilla planifolia]
MASTRAWMLVAALAFLLVARAAGAAETTPVSTPIGSKPADIHAPENQEEETQSTSITVPGLEEKNDPTDLSSMLLDYQQDLVVLGH